MLSVRCIIYIYCAIRTSKESLFILLQGCIFFYNPPPPWGGGKESKGLRAREENQRRGEKWKGRAKRREKFPWVIRENQCFHLPN
jgi:hypothetical protein